MQLLLPHPVTWAKSVTHSFLTFFILGSSVHFLVVPDLPFVAFKNVSLAAFQSLCRENLWFQLAPWYLGSSSRLHPCLVSRQQRLKTWFGRSLERCSGNDCSRTSKSIFVWIRKLFPHSWSSGTRLDCFLKDHLFHEHHWGIVWGMELTYLMVFRSSSRRMSRAGLIFQMVSISKVQLPLGPKPKRTWHGWWFHLKKSWCERKYYL